MSSWFSRVQKLVDEEFHALHPKLVVANVLGRLLPPQVASGLRGRILEQVGFRFGEGTKVYGQPRITSGNELAERLVVGRDCVIEVGCTFDLEETITLEDRVTIGHQVMILTSTHELGPSTHRAGTVTRAPVTVKTGAWLGPRCIVLPGVTIGEGAIVMPGSLVNKDVAPNTRVSGTPARPTETLP